MAYFLTKEMYLEEIKVAEAKMFEQAKIVGDFKIEQLSYQFHENKCADYFKTMNDLTQQFLKIY